MPLFIQIALGILLAYLVITNIAIIGYILIVIVVLAVVYGIFSIILNGLNQLANIFTPDENEPTEKKVADETIEKIENLFDFNKRLSKIKNHSILINFIKIFNYIYYPFEYLFLKSDEYQEKYKYLSILIGPITIILMFCIFAFYAFIFFSLLFIFAIK